MADNVRSIPRWEKNLKNLIFLGMQITDVSREVEQRLAWVLNYSQEGGYSSLTPKLQKMTRKGTWTKGRNVALKNLFENSNRIEGLTSQDQSVCKAIRCEQHRDFGYYGRVEYVFNMAAALPALAGHPLIFLGESDGPLVELVAADPEIRIAKTKAGITLQMEPDPTDLEGRIMLVRDTPTRFKVYRVDGDHRLMASLIRKCPTIPVEGEALVKQAIDALSSKVTIQSDIAGGRSAQEINGDATPHVLIMPWKDGISIGCMVAPFGGNGPYFQPGQGGKTVLARIDDTNVQAQRNLAREEAETEGIVASCPGLAFMDSILDEWQVEDPASALEVLLELKACEDRIVLEWPNGERFRVRREVSFDSFSLKIKKEKDWFKAVGGLKIDKDLTVDLKDLLVALEDRQGRFIPLEDGVFVTVTNDLRKRLEEFKAFSETHGKGVRFSPLAALAMEDLTDNLPRVSGDTAWKTHVAKFSEVIRPEVPSTLQATLREYQAEGFKWLAQLSHWNVGACLADDMGLGKTVQALAAMLLRAGTGPSLVIAPVSVISNWEEECLRFAPTMNPIHFGPGDRKAMIENLQPFDLVITSYGLLPLETELLTQVEWQTLVLDEAQAIKNMHTKRSRAAMQLQARFRIATTGTPMENHLGELWNLFNFLNPGLLGTYTKFTERFALPIERDNDRAVGNRLRKLIRPFILRRVKSEVLQELPAKTEVTMKVEMSREEAHLYEAQRQRALENIAQADEGEPGQRHLRILAEIMKLRRLCCNPALVLPGTDIPSSKLKVFGDIVGELLANKHKALVFSQFVDHLKIIRGLLDEREISYQYLDGSTPLAKRKERIKKFQEGQGDLFLISLKAGGYGLNLTAADYVIHMDPWWNPAVEDQASDRAHRIGQQRPVTVYRLVMADSIEEQIVALHKEKRDLATRILAGSDTAGKVSADDLLELLRGEKEGYF